MKAFAGYHSREEAHQQRIQWKILDVFLDDIVGVRRPVGLNVTKMSKGCFAEVNPMGIPAGGLQALSWT